MKKAKKRIALKQFRIGKGYTQKKFATVCKVSDRTYGLIENGKRSGKQAFWDTLQETFNVPDAEMYSLQKLTEMEVNR